MSHGPPSELEIKVFSRSRVGTVSPARDSGSLISSMRVDESLPFLAHPRGGQGTSASVFQQRPPRTLKVLGVGVTLEEKIRLWWRLQGLAPPG